MGYVLAVLTVWALIGLLIALVYRRAGHSTVVFATFGLVLGPLTILLFGDLRDDDVAEPIVVRSGEEPTDRGLRVIVAVDENEDSTRSASAAVRMLGPYVAQLTVASVIDYETARAPRQVGDPLPRQAHLEATAELCGDPAAAIVLLAGRTDRALLAHASGIEADLLVVSNRRHRLSAILLGSTVARLARQAGLAVLIGPAPGHVGGSNDPVCGPKSAATGGLTESVSDK